MIKKQVPMRRGISCSSGTSEGSCECARHGNNIVIYKKDTQSQRRQDRAPHASFHCTCGNKYWGSAGTKPPFCGGCHNDGMKSDEWHSEP
mmetsp:Transcript_14287/g.27740  ORF Transcript_14287/g.27740 Transcript_14287/m.27740 type:complete len:90 (-) Transcript_14287:2509-2778(-)